jgi:hypothetical protein
MTKTEKGVSYELNQFVLNTFIVYDQILSLIGVTNPLKKKKGCYL